MPPNGFHFKLFCHTPPFSCISEFVNRLLRPDKDSSPFNIYKISFLIACISLFDLENDKLIQSELNGKNNENDQIFEVPGHNENLRRRILFWP
jgi:hypothetical protein